MSTPSYRHILTDPNQPSFARLPLFLPAPRQGRTWTIHWLKRDGQLVLAEECLLRLQSDTGHQQETFSSPAPGRLLIRVPDGRFVAHYQPVAELQYGIGFTPPPARTDTEERLRREIAAVRRTERENARRREALQLEIRDSRERLADLRRRIGQLEAQKAVLNDADETALEGVPALLSDFVDILLARLQDRRHRPDPPSFSVIRHCLLLLERLDAPAGSSALQEGIRPRCSPELLGRLFRSLIPQTADSPAGLPPSIRRHRQECWEEVEEALRHRSDPPAEDP